MGFEQLFIEGVIKALPNLGVALLILLLGWFVGSRISVHWSLRQRRKELDIMAAKNFYSLYGEFFALWKLWNYYVRDIGPDKFPEASRWKLLDRACVAEAGVEAMFVKFASERKMSENEIKVLGKFRQAYQNMRETIRDERPLKWDWHEHPEYLAFKRLGAKVAFFILTGAGKSPSTESECVVALKTITDNKWEPNWAQDE